MATEHPTHQDDNKRGVNVLGIGPDLAPGTHPVEPDPAVVGRPSHLPNQGSELAMDLGDGRPHGAPRLLQRPSVLHRQVDPGAWHTPSPRGKVSTEAVNTQRTTPIIVDHTIKRPNTTLM